MINKNSGQIRFEKNLMMLVGAWLITAVLSDELIAFIFVSDPSSGFGFSIGQVWWWVYQFKVAAFFAFLLVYISVLSRNRLSSVS